MATEEPGHIACPFCGGLNEATVRNEEERIDLLTEPTLNNVDHVMVVVPVWTCNLCGKSWTNYIAEELRQNAIVQVLDDGGFPTY